MERPNWPYCMSDHASAAVADSAVRTRWGYIALLLAAGVCAAMQVGKAPPALSALQRDLSFGIVAAAWVISMFSAIGAASGFLAGSVVNRFGALRMTVAGLLVMAVGSALGAFAQGPALLLASRAVEGMAFIFVAVAIPGLLVASAAPGQGRFVSAVWGTFMPTGMAIALTLSPLILLSRGWRAVWEINAILLVVFALALAIAKPSQRKSTGPEQALTLEAVRSTLANRTVLMLAFCFTCYTFQYLAVLGFLPVILEQQGLTTQTAGNLTAIAAIANAVGNLAAGWLIARQVLPWKLMVAASVAMAISVVGVYSSALPPSLRFWLVAFFALTGGLIPASIFASTATVARHAKSGALTMGLVTQASNLGQLLGPPVVAAIAAWRGGWHASPAALVPAALLALIAAYSLRSSRT
jgi:MFS family permease